MSEIYLFTFFAPCWALVGLRWLGLLENELNLGFGTLQHFGASKNFGDEEEFLSPAWTNKRSLASSGNSSPTAWRGYELFIGGEGSDY